jgi:hypothetical protein
VSGTAKRSGGIVKSKANSLAVSVQNGGTDNLQVPRKHFLSRSLCDSGTSAVQTWHPGICVVCEVRYARRPLTQPAEVSFDSGSGHCDTNTKHTTQSKTQIIAERLDTNSGNSNLPKRQRNCRVVNAYRLWQNLGPLRSNTPSGNGIIKRKRTRPPGRLFVGPMCAVRRASYMI